MTNAKHIESIAMLSESEGVFTTAQAERMGIPRDALHDAVSSGRIIRVMHGAYRMVGSGSSELDELTAIWKLTAPAKFSHERLNVEQWDGIVIGGSTASALLEIGELYMSPYQIYTPKRINSRKSSVHFVRRAIPRCDVMIHRGLPVTRPERTVFDLMLDDEDSSLVANVLRDAYYSNSNFDFAYLQELLMSHYSSSKSSITYEALLVDAGLTEQSA